MKINSITTSTSYPGRAAEHPLKKERECAYKRHNLNQNNNDQINTTIKMNSDGRASFKGGGVPLLHKAANFASENPLVAEALFAILITCGLRPLTIMATAKTEEDKEKCSYQAAKSVSTGVVGLAMSVLVGVPIAAAAKAVYKKGALKIPDKVKEKATGVVKQGTKALSDLAKRLTETNADDKLAQQITELATEEGLNLNVFKQAGKGSEKTFIRNIKETAPEIFKIVKKAIKEQKAINNYERANKNVIDKLFQPIFMPIRATITVALVPIILNALGLKKSGKKPPEQKQQNPYESLKFTVFQDSSEKELFQSFAGVTNYENK